MKAIGVFMQGVRFRIPYCPRSDIPSLALQNIPTNQRKKSQNQLFLNRNTMHRMIYSDKSADFTRIKLNNWSFSPRIMYTVYSGNNQHIFIFEYRKEHKNVTKSRTSDKYCKQIKGKWNTPQNMVILHLYNERLISYPLFALISGHFDGDIGAQTVLNFFRNLLETPWLKGAVHRFNIWVHGTVSSTEKRFTFIVFYLSLRPLQSI